MFCARIRFHAHVQGHNKGSKVSLRGCWGHLLNTVTFLVLVSFAVALAVSVLLQVFWFSDNASF